MDLIKTKKDKSQLHLLLKDHIPNLAMKNEFQTQNFMLRLNRLEIVESNLAGYEVDEGGVFLLASITLKNLSNEILSFSRNDLLVSYDKESPYEAEEYFDVENQLEDEIALKPNEEVKGKIVYIIASNAKKITFRYLDALDDEKVKEDLNRVVSALQDSNSDVIRLYHVIQSNEVGIQNEWYSDEAKLKGLQHEVDNLSKSIDAILEGNKKFSGNSL